MNRVLTLLSLSVLATGLVAQTRPAPPKFKALVDSGVIAALDKTDRKVIAKDKVFERPQMLQVMVPGANRGEMAGAGMKVGAYMPSKGQPLPPLGAFLENHGKLVFKQAKNPMAGTVGQAFQFVARVPAPVEGKWVVVFKGHYVGRGTAIAATFNRQLLKPTAVGKFLVKKEFPQARTSELKVAFGMTAKATVAGGGYAGHLSFTFVPKAAQQPMLVWSVPRQPDNCAKPGLLAGPARPVEFDKPVILEVKDRIADRTPAILLIGFRKDKWFFFNLPLKLDPFNFNGCLLFIAPDNMLPGAFKTGVARFPFTIKKLHSKFFRKLYFQAFYPKANSLVFTNYGELTKK